MTKDNVISLLCYELEQQIKERIDSGVTEIYVFDKAWPVKSYWPELDTIVRIDVIDKTMKVSYDSFN